jgi:hypothetical protein
MQNYSAGTPQVHIQISCSWPLSAVKTNLAQSEISEKDRYEIDAGTGVLTRRAEKEAIGLDQKTADGSLIGPLQLHRERA